MKLFKTAVATAALLSAATAVSADDISEEMRDVDSFKRVSLHGSMDVEVKVGPAQSVKVIADSDIIEYLRTRVRGNELEIELDHDHGNRRLFRNIKKMQIIVTVPELDGASIHGSGDMFVEDVKSDRFRMAVHGSGDAVVENAAVERLTVDVHGSGDVRIEGSCEDVDIEIHGSGDVRAGKMQCQNAEVTVQGSGDAGVYASKSADVTVQGSGDVSVSGKPGQINSRVQGSGDIHVR